MNYYIVKYMSVIHLVPKLNLGTRERCSDGARIQRRICVL